MKAVLLPAVLVVLLSADSRCAEADGARIAPPAKGLLSAVQHAPVQENPASSEKKEDAEKGKSEKDKAEKSPEDIQKQLRKLRKEQRGNERKLKYERMQRKIDEMSMRSEMRAAEAAVEQTKGKLGLAELKLEHYLKGEQPLIIARAGLAIERGEWSVKADQQELDELKTMYEAEEFAELTKELVLQRGQVRLEFSQKGLEHSRRDLELKRWESQRKQRGMEQEIESAREAVMAAESKLPQMQLEHELKRIKNEDQVQELELQLKEQAEEQQELEKKLSAIQAAA